MAVFAGDINAEPATPTLEEFEKNWLVEDFGVFLPTFPSGNPNRQIDFIISRDAPAPPQWQLISIFVVDEPIASDHRPIVADFIPV